jgi:uncharacterized protein (TIGR03437 family)
MNRRISFLAALLAGTAAAQMLVRVRNAADPVYSAIVPGSLASVFIESDTTPPGPVVLKPSTTSVTINGEPASVLGSDNQGGVLVLIPSDTPLGHQTGVNVDYQFQGRNLTGTATVACVGSLFGFFTLGFGYGPALAVQGNGQKNTFLHPALPGDIVSLWGTGMGDATPDQFTVLLGGHAAPVLYAGPAPGLPGVDQVNFLVPNDPAIPDGCSVALEVDVANFRSNVSQLSKASSPGPCESGIGLSVDQLAQLDAGGTVDVVSFYIHSAVTLQRDGSFGRTESFSAFNDAFNARIIGPGPLFADDVVYSCRRPPLVAPLAGADVVGQGGKADIGPIIVLTGPSSSDTVPGTLSQYVLNPPEGTPAPSLDGVSPSYFTPGTWQVTGGGNPIIGPYQSQINVPPTIQVTNYPDLQSIDATMDLLVQWNPAGYGSSDLVTLGVTIASLSAITCQAHATDGQITVPAKLIQSPSASLASFTISVQGFSSPFSVPLNDGTTLPAGFDYRFSDSFTGRIR